MVIIVVLLLLLLFKMHIIFLACARYQVLDNNALNKLFIKVVSDNIYIYIYIYIKEQECMRSVECLRCVHKWP